MSTFIENPQQMETKADFPLVGFDAVESDGLLGQDLRDINEMAVPLDFTVVAHLANHYTRGIANRENLTAITTCRGMTHTGRGFSCQSFMGAQFIILLQ